VKSNRHRNDKGQAAMPNGPAGVEPRLSPEAESGSSPGGRTCTPPAPHAPPQIPDYELVRCIGVGSYGDVWLARNALGRYDAVKVIYRDRFEHARPYDREFEGIRKYEPVSRKHASQVALLHVGRDATDQYYYYAMELADDVERGQEIEPESYRPRSLETELRRRSRLPVGDCVELGLALTQALEQLHAEGLIHRDIKPGNIIWVGGVPKLADIGLVAEKDQTMTLVGTRGYLPPEGPGSVAGDIYSLGKVLYECSTGQDRQEFPNLPAELADRIGHAQFLEFNEVILKACHSDPRKRYQAAREVHDDLMLIHAGRSLRRKHVLERRFTLLARASMAVAALAILAASGYWFQKRQTEEAQESRQRAERAVKHLELKQAEEMFAADQASTALASLARLLREDPTDRMVAERILAALSQRSFPLPVARLAHTADGTVATFSSDGRRIITGSQDGTVTVWDVQTGGRIGPPLQHDGPISFIEPSPSGRMTATASGGQVRVWNAETGQPVTDWLPQSRPVRIIRFSSDETRLLLCLSSEAVMLDARNGNKLAGPLHMPEAITGTDAKADFSPDGNRIAVACSDRAVKVWDLQTGSLLCTFTHPGRASVVCFSPDGTRLLIASGVNTARLWDSRTGRLLVSLVGHDFPVNHAAFSQDGARVITGSNDRTARIWDAQTGELRVGRLQHFGFVSHVDFSADGRLALTASAVGDLRVWNAQSAEPIHEARYDNQSIPCQELSPDGEHILVKLRNESVAWLLDARLGQSLPRVLPHEDFVVFARFNTNSSRLLTTTDWVVSNIQTPRSTRDDERQPDPILRGAARVWEVASGQPVTPPLAHEDGLLSADFNPDGTRIATGCRDQAARIWDATTGELLRELPHESRRGVRSALFTPNGRNLLTSCWLNDGALWDARTGQMLRRFQDQDEDEGSNYFMPVRTADMSRDGRLVVTGSRDGARVWNVETGERLPYVYGAGQNVRAARFSPQGDRLVTAARRETGDSPSCAQVWDVATGQAVTHFLLHNDTVRHAEFSPDGARVVTASLDRTARIWDARTGRQLIEPLQHKGWVMHAEFSPDGQRVVTVSWWDHAAFLWDAHTGLPLGDPLRHDDWVTFATFSPDGRWLVTTSCDGTAKIWALPQATAPVPAWLADLAEAVGGQRLDDLRLPQAVSLEKLWNLRTQLLASPDADAYTRWAQWFFADRATRPNSAYTGSNATDASTP